MNQLQDEHSTPLIHCTKWRLIGGNGKQLITLVNSRYGTERPSIENNAAELTALATRLADNSATSAEVRPLIGGKPTYQGSAMVE